MVLSPDKAQTNDSSFEDCLLRALASTGITGKGGTDSCTFRFLIIHSNKYFQGCFNAGVVLGMWELVLSWSWPGRGHSSPSTTEHSGNRPRHKQLQIGAGQPASRVIRRSPLEMTDFWKAWSSQGRELNGSQETEKKKWHEIPKGHHHSIGHAVKMLPKSTCQSNSSHVTPVPPLPQTGSWGQSPIE